MGGKTRPVPWLGVPLSAAFIKSLVHWLDSRLDLAAVSRAQFTARLVPAPKTRLAAFLENLGFLNAVLFLILMLSGLLLAFQYQPSVDQAFMSVIRLEHQTAGMWLARRIHAVAANLLILGMFLHMIRVVAVGAYKEPRELNWLSGFLLLLLGLGALFTGFLLPMNQTGYWRVMEVTGWLSSLPLLGQWLMDLARGGDNLGQGGLSLYFGLHLSLPLAMLTLIAIHLWLLRRLGVAEPL